MDETMNSPWDMEDHLNNGADQAIAMGLVSPEEAKQRIKAHLEGPNAANASRSIGEAPQVVNLLGNKQVAQTNNKWQRNSSSRTLPTYEQHHAQILQAQGIQPGIKVDANGEEMYNPATNNLGQSIYTLPNGETTLDLQMPGAKPVFDKNNPMYDFTRNKPDPTDPIQKQEAGINQMQSLLAMQNNTLAKQGVSDHVNLSPLANLADYENSKSGIKSNLGAGYVAPQGPEAVRDKLFAYQQKMQEDRAALNKAVAANVGNQNKSGGTLADLLAMAQNNTQQNTQQDAMNTQGTRQQGFEDRQVRMLHDRMLRDAVKDPQLAKYTTQYANLNNAISNLANADHMTPQQFDEAQQAVRANLGIKGSSGVDERSKTMLNSLGYNADRLMQMVTAKPADINQNDPIVQHIKQLAALEQNNVTDQFQRRMAPLLGRNKWIYENPRYDYLKEDLSPFSASMSAQVQNTPLMNQAVAKGNAYNPKNPTAAPRAANSVTVIAPDGTEGTIPRANLDRAVKAGYKLKGQ